MEYCLFSSLECPASNRPPYRIFFNDSQIFFGVSFFLIFTLLKTSRLQPSKASAHELSVHAFSAMLLLPVIGLVLIAWMFIDGASLFVGMVLPFSTNELRPSLLGFWVIWGLTLIGQFFQFREKPVGPKTEDSEAQLTSEPTGQP